jgi:hypothetical protein
MLGTGLERLGGMERVDGNKRSAHSCLRLFRD